MDGKAISMMNTKLNRRSFLKRTTAAAAATAFPAIVPSRVFGETAPGNRITMAFIGVGNQGTNDLQGFLSDDRIQVVAVCDVNRESPGYWSGSVRGRDYAKRLVDSYYTEKNEIPNYKGCDMYEDFRDVLARKDIDVVEIATPDHWHAALVVAAARAGKDIYCQKPLSLTITEGRAMVNAVKRYGRILQTGSQQRSDYNFRRACELVRNGRIGKLETVKCGLPGGTTDYSGGLGVSTDPAPVPEGFNYDLWLGPAPAAPYCPARCHVNFRWVLDYSGGQLTDWGGHHPDIAQWGMGTEDTGPVKVINAKGKFADGPLWNTATEYYFECIYANGVKLIISNRVPGGVTFKGTDGTVWANRGAHKASSPEIMNSIIGPNEIHLYESNDHFRNFIDCVISRREPIAPVETAHRSITLAHLGNIAMMTGRDLTWDPEAEQCVNDPGANTLLGRSWRAPWHI